MATQVIVDQLALKELLDRLPQISEAVAKDDLAYYMRGIGRMELARGSALFLQGQPVDYIYLLISGAILESRASNESDPATKVPLRTVSASDPSRFLGMYDFIYRNPHSTSVTATELSQVVAIQATDFGRLLHRFPDLRGQLMQTDLINRLRTMQLLAGANLTAISYLAEMAQVHSLKARQVLYQAGDAVDRVYLIDSGQMQLEAEGGDLQLLGNGAELGITVTSNASQRTDILDHNAAAACPTRLLSVSRQQFVTMCGYPPEEVALQLRRLRAEGVASVNRFTGWPMDDRVRVLGYVSAQSYPTRHVLVQQGEVSTSMWVVLRGSTAVSYGLSADGKAYPKTRVEGPSSFGEAALTAPLQAPATLESEANGLWLRMQNEDFAAFQASQRAGTQAAGAKAAVADSASQPAVDTAQDSQLSYEWMEPGEYITMLARRHWIVALAKIAPGLLVATWTIALVVGGLLWGWSLPAYWWITGFSALVAVAMLAWGAADYRNDFIVVTNHRVMRQEKVLLIHMNRTETLLEQVQDVSWKSDFWGSKLGYADVRIESAASTSNLTFDRMADYERLTGTIKQGKDRRRSYYHALNKREIQQELEKRLGGGFATPDRVWNGGDADPSTASGDRLSAGESARQELRAMADSTETITWHKHWIVLVRNAIVPSMLVLLLIVASAAAWFWRDAFGNSLIPLVIAVWATVFASAWLLWRIENWRNDEYILEKDLLIDIEATPLGVQKSKRTADLARIVDLTYRINGPIHTLFNYGDVLAQTAGTDGYFSFVDVGAPSQVVETIRRRMNERAREEERRQTALRARELPDWLEVYSRVDPNLADRMEDRL